MNAEEFAKQIVASYCQESVKSVVPIVGKGSVNQIFLAVTDSVNLIVRMNSHDRAFLDYQKEAWCIKQASRCGIPSPSVFTIGKQDKYSYMVESFVPGDNGEDCIADYLFIWHELGGYLQTIRSIPVTGFGDMLSDSLRGEFIAPLHEGFDGSWEGFLHYNLVSLSDCDPLIDLGIVTTAQSRSVRRLFEQLRELHVDFGLNHGDLSLKNTIVSPSKKIHLLDWGSAEVNITPYWDIIQVLQCYITMNCPNYGELMAFISGYGFTQSEYADMEPLFQSLLLLRCFDKLRWAIERSPNSLRYYSDYAKLLVDRFL